MHLIQNPFWNLFFILGCIRNRLYSAQHASLRSVDHRTFWVKISCSDARKLCFLKILVTVSRVLSATTPFSQ